MKGLPIRRNQLRVGDFASWLASNGAEVGKPTNPYEVIRYRAYWHGSAKAVTHVVYAKESGLLTFTSGSREHYEAFLAGAPMATQVPRAEPPTDPRGRSDEHITKNEKLRRKLRERDGDQCWFCGRVLGGDCTLEHLMPKSKGGPNAADNYALAHKACNHAAADLPLVQKIALREKMRTGVSA